MTPDGNNSFQQKLGRSSNTSNQAIIMATLGKKLGRSRRRTGDSGYENWNSDTISRGGV